MEDFIKIRGAREHNLKNISLDIPKNQLVVITGLSGSGKSSLAFDTLYAEGQRRYVESLSAYARQFLNLMQKPDVDHIDGLSPAISIEQKTTSKNPRSTVGTVTEIYDYLRLLYARIGVPYSPTTGKPIKSQTITEMVDKAMSLGDGQKIQILAPIVRGRKGEYRKELEDIKKQGFQRVKIDGVIYEIDETPTLNKKLKHTIEIVIDRMAIKDGSQQRLAEGFETALRHSDNLVIIDLLNGEEILFSTKYACPESGFTIEEIEPRLFSFNSPFGACPTCNGLGVEIYYDPDKVIPDQNKSLKDGAISPWNTSFSFYYLQMLDGVLKHYGGDLNTPFCKLPQESREVVLYGSGREKIEITVQDGSRHHKSCKPFEGVIPSLIRREKEKREKGEVFDEINHFQSSKTCESCKGWRLNDKALAIKINDLHLGQITDMSIEKSFQWFEELVSVLTEKESKIAERILKEIRERLSFLVNVGLSYLNLARSAGTLSGGESQRIRLASQIGSGLTGVLYVLDEPSIGLHQRDNDKLLETLSNLKNLGNTVVVVEHDEDAIRESDFLIDMGPGAGSKGGEVIFAGHPKDIEKCKASVTGQYISGTKKIEIPKSRRKINKAKQIKITGASTNNLKSVNVSFPLGVMTCVTGVSGGGKSSLAIETLYKGLNQQLGIGHDKPGPFKKLEGVEMIDKIIDIDQSPIGRTPRSNPATYAGIFTPIRDWFAGLPDAKSRGYNSGRFSFNVKGGRCEACHGDGLIKIEMHFLPDVYVECDQCRGKRYNRETLEIKFKDKSIADVLDMTVDEAAEFFDSVPSIANKLKVLQSVGLGYIHVGQQATTLSGGEAQRIKLAKELSKRSTGKTLYIMDEPTTGLHFDDINKLLEVLHKLVDQGNTIIIIEHNLDVIKTADWIIDIGPEGGDAGGNVVAEGTPEEIIKVVNSYTGKYLKRYLDS